MRLYFHVKITNTVQCFLDQVLAWRLVYERAQANVNVLISCSRDPQPLKIAHLF